MTSGFDYNEHADPPVKPDHFVKGQAEEILPERGAAGRNDDKERVCGREGPERVGRVPCRRAPDESPSKVDEDVGAKKGGLEGVDASGRNLAERQ